MPVGRSGFPDVFPVGLPEFLLHLGGEPGHPFGFLFGDSHPVDGFQVGKDLFQFRGALDLLADQAPLS